MADVVHGSGPRPAAWAVVGTEPGFREMKKGEVFVGPTGEELMRLLALIGRNRKNTFLTNLFREPPPAKKVPHTDEQRAYGLACLKRELAEVRPRYIITLGAPIARLFLGDEVDIDEAWGLHLKPSEEARALFGLRPDCTLFPQVHPAAGFHSADASSRVLVGFEDMQRKLEDGEAARGLYDDEHPNPSYTYTAGPEDVLDWVGADLPIALDTEGYNHAPWSVQASTSAGSAILIRNTQPDELGALKRRIAAAPSVTMHAGLHDLSVLRQLGIDLIEMGVPFDDTQLMAYLLNVEPQGLKPLMTRHCGMRVKSYQEVLGDAQDRHTRNYLAQLWEKLHARHEQFRREDFHYQTVRLGRRIKKLPDHPKTSLHKAVERVMGSKEPSKLWQKQVEDYRVEAYKWMGDEVPEASLSDVDPAVALDYACKDPDGTGRVLTKLRPRIRALGLEEVYRLDLSTYPIIDRMMRVGITPDVDAFADLGRTLDTEIAGVLRRIRIATGASDFNPNSGDQVAEYLFDVLDVEPMGKRTTSGRESTNDKVLEALEHAYPEHEEIADVRTYRELYKLRWTFCVAPKTRILTDDLQWIHASEVTTATRLIGFDETPTLPGTGTRRSVRFSTVKAVETITKPCYRLHLEDGSQLECSGDHQWLCRSNTEYKKLRWVRTDDLMAEDSLGRRGGNRQHNFSIVKPFDVWEADFSHEGGWLAGMLDGEGNVSVQTQGRNGSIRVTIGQNDNDSGVLARLTPLLDHYNPSIYVRAPQNNSQKHVVLAVLGPHKCFELLGRVRPTRLLNNFKEKTVLSGLDGQKAVRVVRREYLGEQPVIAIQTSTHTYFAEGFASHNCERLPRLIERWPHDGRIHCDLMMTRTPSGRLAAKKPNLLAMPKHGKFAKAFRRCFVPGAGRLFLSADESQVELRVGAHLSQDPVMLDIFAGRRRNPDGSLIDLHAAMVQRVTGTDPRDQSDADRLIGKCFHPDTEVLTRDGWKRIAVLEKHEEVIQATPADNGEVSLSWTRPVALTTRYAETLVHLKNEGIDLRVTPDHGMVGWAQGGQLRRFIPESLSKARYWANAGRLESTGMGPSPVMLRLAVAAQADGSIEGKRLRFGFSKPRKIQRFQQLLKTAGIAVEPKLYSNGKYEPTTVFRLDRSQAAPILELLDTDKTFPWWWLELPEGAREVVLSEFPYWDGHQRPEWRATRYTSFKQKNLDVLQALAAITGRKTRQKGHDLTVRARATTRGGNLEAQRLDYQSQVYCLSVPSGAVLVRDGGIPVITHQCINFGYWMGQTAIGLTLELRKSGLDIDEDDAQRWIDEANALYVGAVAYKEEKVAEATRNGYVRCLSGRIRYIGGIRSRDERVRAEAERFAYSTPIQEGAQWIGKQALKAAWDELFVPWRKLGRWVEPVLWIHDDLLSEADPETIMEMAPKLQAIMTRKPEGFSVPLATKPEAGMNWADMTTL